MRTVEAILVTVDANLDHIKPKDCVGWIFHAKSTDKFTILKDMEDILKSNAYFQAIPQQLYLTTFSLQINKGDWFIVDSVNPELNNKPFKYIRDKQIDLVVIRDEAGKETITTKHIFVKAAKIVASRNPNLYALPNIPQEAILSFVNSNGEKKEYNIVVNEEWDEKASKKAKRFQWKFTPVTIDSEILIEGIIPIAWKEEKADLVKA